MTITANPKPIMSFKDFMYTIQNPGKTPPGSTSQARRPGYQPDTPRKYAQTTPHGPTNPTGDADFFQRQASYLRGLEQYDPLSSVGAPAAAPTAAPPLPQAAPPPVPQQGLLDQNQEGPSEGLLAGKQGGQGGGWGNKIGAIGRLLSAAGQGWMAGNQPGPNQGMQLGLAGTNVVNEGENIKNEQYQRIRQEMLDRIEQQKALGKAAGPKQHILPPGAVLTDAEGKPLFSNPMAEKAEKLSSNAEIVSKLSDPNLSPEERQYWQGIYEDATRPPVGPTINIPGPVKQDYVKLPDGRMGAFNPISGTVVPITDAPPPESEQPRQLSSKEQDLLDTAEERIAGGENTIRNLERASELNDLAAGGPAANYTKYFDYFINPKKYHATEELNTVVMRNAVTNLKQMMGSQPTDKDLAILAEIEGSLTLTPTARAEVFKRNRNDIANMVDRMKGRRKDIKAGTFGTTTTTTPGAPSAPVRRRFNPATGKIE